MKNSKNKLLSLVSLLSVLAVLAPITGDDKWLTFLCFLSFSVFTSVKSDERFKQNRDKAARNGFISSILCITLLTVYLTTKPDNENILFAIQGILWVIALTFAVSYYIYNRRGE